MPFFVYIIRSKVDGTFYKGSTENIEARIQEHNSFGTKHTSKKQPWKLVFLMELPSKSEALIKERKLKKYSHNSLKALIVSSQNLLNKRN